LYPRLCPRAQTQTHIRTRRVWSRGCFVPVAIPSGSNTGGNILHPHPYVAPIMFWRKFRHWGYQYVSSVIYIVDGISDYTSYIHPSLMRFIFFLHKSFCLLDDQCAFIVALLGHLFSAKKKNGPHASKIKANGSPHEMFSCNVGLELPQDFV